VTAGKDELDSTRQRAGRRMNHKKCRLAARLLITAKVAMPFDAVIPDNQTD
jgi:hypothetical protein